MVKLIVYITKTIVAILVALVVASCQFSFDLGDSIKGSGNVISENRPVNGDFTSIEASRGIDVIVAQSNIKSIEVKADDNIIEHISTDINNSVLTITLDKSVKNLSSKKVYVTLPNIESLRSSSGSSISSKNALVVKSIDVKSSSGSEINIDVEAEKIICDSSSGSEISVEGKAIKLEVSSSSGSEIEAQNLLANDIIANSSSGSSIEIHPIISLSAKASSGSDIIYYNNPKSLTKKSSSGGSIKSY
jgi:hypothetical protein